MKLQIFFLLTITSGIFAHAVPALEQRSLQDDLQDFLDLIPFEQIKNTIQEYLDNDAEVQEAFEYLKSDEFAAAWKYAIEHPDILEILDYLQESGLDVVQLLNKIADFLGLQNLEPRSLASYSEELARSTGGVKELVDKITNMLPLSDLMILFFDKMDNSEDFQKLMIRIQSADFQKIVDFVENSPEILALIDKLENLGFDVNAIIDFIKSFFGWS